MDRERLQRTLVVARGEAPCDLLLRRARVLNVFTGEIEPEQCVAIYEGRFAGFGAYEEGRVTADLGGAVIAPGFIDGHIHLESTCLKPSAFAELAVPCGTAAVVADPHEIVNVKGLAGLRYMIEATRDLPLAVYFMAPSCVPATEFETSGARLGAEEITAALGFERVIGLAEMMNYPGVIHGEAGVLAKLAAAERLGAPVDGHSPGLRGRGLEAYIDAGIGTDHESTTYEEGREKLRRGMFLLIREGSAERNLDALLPLVSGYSDERCLFVTDDRTPRDLDGLGHMDHIVRRAISLGLPPIRAYALASINAARCYRLSGRGAAAPGYRADFTVLDNVEEVRIAAVYHDGREVARAGRALFKTPEADDSAMRGSFDVRGFSPERLRLPAAGRESFPVIEIIPGQILTRRRDLALPVRDGCFASDPAGDVLKLAVVERHNGTGNVGLGFVRGLGLRRGAVASSVAHDSHNIIAAGATDEDLYLAIKEVIEMGGGMAVEAEGKVLARLPLPVAGLLSDRPAGETIRAYEELERAARKLGEGAASPFAALSFLALPVIPELRLTDLGLFDASAFRLLDSAAS